MTQRMADALETQATRHGVPPAFMLRVIIMWFVDQPARAVEDLEWKDTNQFRNMAVVSEYAISPATDALLKKRAAVSGLPKTQLVRVALRRYFSEMIGQDWRTNSDRPTETTR